MREIYWGDSRIKRASNGGGGEIVHRNGEAFYKISNYRKMAPFFVSVVSGTEHWMFLSSSGGLTCGRRNPDNALFPYYTDDKIHDAIWMTGSKTVLLVERGGRVHLWRPFIQGVTPHSLQRNLYKNLLGTRLVYEEVNHDLDLAFSYSWSTSDNFGFVKESGLRNLGESECEVEILDGLVNLLPHGVTRQMQNELSTLLDAYKQAELVPGLAVGIYSLSSILTDRAEPCEALKATVAWSRGLDNPKVLLSEDQLEAFCNGKAVSSENLSRGKRGAFFVQSAFSLAPGSKNSWHIVADINQGSSELQALLKEIRLGVSAEAINRDIQAGGRRLMQLVGGADGCQLSSDNLVTARHFSNTLFNIMRGGTFFDGYSFSREDFLDFIETWNSPLRDEVSSLLDSVNGPLTLDSVLGAAERGGSADLERLALEYLPLTFSRRHGDPSRPWNQFSIDIKNDDGSDKLHFEGNWRDIFQNWEALSLSYPEYIESFIAKFVNASTADGYNPYRITKDGIDWEVLEPENSWSNIGYWGDHQINYLLKLLELSRSYHPGKISELLTREIFAYANVPYRIRRYGDLLKDPRNTVVYDETEEALISRRVEVLGSDGKLVARSDGSVDKVNLLEKLLVPVLAKLGNFVPGGGIWMNTQRPEWNDANNALVGYGLSMVTLCYLRRFMVLFSAILDEGQVQEFRLSSEVSSFFADIDHVLQEHSSMLEAGVSAEQRRSFMDTLGIAGEAYRESIYSGFSGEKSIVRKSELVQFIELALKYCDHSIACNKRPDGLFHSYNLIRFGEDGYEVEHLDEMLEGQVAVLSSAYLGQRESLELLQNLAESELYRSDQNSYILYPDRTQTRFLDKNVIDRSLVEANAWIRNELKSGRRDFVEQDVEGKVHFNAGFRNAGELAAALACHEDISEEDALALCAVYEDVFRHRRFTGRSGSMFKYEGLGSIYWHMVSKLLLATAEVIAGTKQSDIDEATQARLMDCYDEIKDGLGLHKTPAQYGAFPIDPYSHTPGFIGVQQPGMTGQVKEDFITRFYELGVKVVEGQIEFAPTILKRDEFTTGPESWNYSLGGEEQHETLEAGCLAFSVCATPVVYRMAQEYAIRVINRGGHSEVITGNQLDRARSQSVFKREGEIQKIVVDVPETALRT
jgi:hypothetical protein